MAALLGLGLETSATEQLTQEDTNMEPNGHQLKLNELRVGVSKVRCELSKKRFELSDRSLEREKQFLDLEKLFLERNEPCLEPSEPRLQPNHDIFLSHSGVQKDFTRHIFEALKKAHHFPFLDVDVDSLRKGEQWEPTLMAAARQYYCLVLVLSKESCSTSKWSLMDLNAFVKGNTSSLKILPLFLKIPTIQRRVEAKKWRERWNAMKVHDAKIGFGQWVDAVSKITKYGAME